MITEDYVSFDVAKLLKEKGFDEICSYEWGLPEVDLGYVLQKWAINNGQVKNSDLIDEAYAAPTHQMAMKWLREMHNLLITVDRSPHGYILRIETMPLGVVKYITPEICNKRYIESYEEACEAAIKYCLEKLI